MAVLDIAKELAQIAKSKTYVSIALGDRDSRLILKIIHTRELAKDYIELAYNNNGYDINLHLDNAKKQDEISIGLTHYKIVKYLNGILLDYKNP
jgi:hypothetical protein